MLNTLLHSKAFWLAVIDALCKIGALLGARYWPEQAKFVNDLWLALQPIVLIVVGALATGEIVVPALLARLR